MTKPIIDNSILRSIQAFDDAIGDKQLNFKQPIHLQQNFFKVTKGHRLLNMKEYNELIKATTERVPTISPAPDNISLLLAYKKCVRENHK